MVSISSNQSASQASSYYTKENYYQTNSEIGYFYGHGIEEIGFKNGTPVTKETYKNLLQGLHPTSKEKLVKNALKDDRRAGFDVTFSAPKSVSVLLEYLEANGDIKTAEKIRNAHSKATKKSMKTIEENYVNTRVKLDNSKSNKDVDKIKTNGLMYATFQHDTTRVTPTGDIDPQLHNHNFIFNVVTYRDGNNIKTATLSNEEIFRNKMLIGLNYRSELSSNLQKLGIEIEVTNAKEAFFEVKGFTQEQLDEFSGRSESLKELLEKWKEKYPNTNESKLKELIIQKTKSAKIKINRRDLYEANKIRLERSGINKELIENKILKDIGKDLRPVLDPKEITRHVSLSAEVLTDKQSVFKKEDVLKESMKFGISKGITLESYEKNFVEENIDIIKLDDNNNYSTVTMIEAEQTIFEATQNTPENKETPYISLEGKGYIDNFIDQHKKFHTMTDGQRKMTNTILTSNNKYIAIQGDAGTGKTFSAEAIKEFMAKNNPEVELVGLSFTGQASKLLEDNSGIKSSTIDSFLLSEEKQSTKSNRKRLLIIDEIGMAGAKQIAKLIKISKKDNSKIIYMGDKKQFPSVSAGRVARDVQAYGMETSYLNETKRFKNNFTLELVNAVKNKDIDKAFAILDEQKALKEMPKDKSIREISKDYREAPEKEKPLIITSRNDERRVLNEMIRNDLKKDNKLKDGYILSTLEQIRGIEGASAEFGGSYEKDMILALNKVSHFRNGEQVKVVGRVENTHDKIRVMRKEGGTVDLDLKNIQGKVQAFKQVEREFSKGDRLFFSKNVQSKNLRVKNGQIANIDKVDKNGNITLDTGKKFNIKDNPFVEHGYAITDVKSQGKTTPYLIILADSNMANYNSFYTQITRPKYGVKIYTDNRDLLKVKVADEQVKKSTLDFKDINKEKDLHGRDIKEARNNGKEPEQTNEQVKGNREIKLATSKSNTGIKEREYGNERTLATVNYNVGNRGRERLLDRSVRKNINSPRGTIRERIGEIEKKVKQLVEKINLRRVKKRMDKATDKLLKYLKKDKKVEQNSKERKENIQEQLKEQQQSKQEKKKETKEPHKKR